MGFLILFGLLAIVSGIVIYAYYYKYADFEQISATICCMSIIMLIILVPVACSKGGKYKYEKIYKKYEDVISNNTIYAKEQLDEIKAYNDFIEQAHINEHSFFLGIFYDEYHELELLDYDKALNAWADFISNRNKEKNNG